MKIKTTIYLILIAILFAGFILFYEKYTPPTKEIERSKVKPFTIKLENIKKITLKNTYEKNITVSKDEEGEGWSIIHPMHTEGDIDKIEEIVHRLETIQSARTITGAKKNALKLSDFGLNNPPFEVTILANDKSVKLSIGKKTPLGKNIYTMLNNDSTSIYLLPDDLIEVINKNIDDLRNKKVTRFDINKIARLDINNKKEIFTYLKNGNGWYLSEPFLHRANEEKIYSFLNKLHELAIVKFADNDPSYLTQYGLGEKDRLEITLSVTPKIQKFIMFGKIINNDETWGYTKVFDKNYIYLSKHEILADIPQRVEEWRDTKVIRFNPAKVNKFKYKFRNKTLALSKAESGQWFIDEPVKMQADEEKIKDVLVQLYLLTTEKFVSEDTTDIAKYGLSEPEGDIVLGFSNSEEIKTLLLSKSNPKEGKIYLKNNSENSIFMVQLGIFDSIFRDYIEYKDRTFWSIPSDQAVSLSIQVKNNVKNITYGTNKQWMLDGHTIDPKQVYDLLLKLANPRAFNYVSLTQDSKEKYGLDKPQIIVTVGIMQNNNLVESKILVGNKTKFETYYAQVDGKDEIFTIGKELYDLFVVEY